MSDHDTQPQSTPSPGPRPGNAQWLGTRSEQQDSFGFAGFDGQGQAGPDGVLAVVADGMGGLSGGRAASQEAVKTFLAAWAARPAGEPVPDRLLAAIQAANRTVYDLAHGTAGEGGVGTTLVAAAVNDNCLFWIAAGDSRLYLYRAADASLTPCNEEHNLASQLWRQSPGNGQTQESIDSHPERDSLTSFLGLAEIPELDRNIRPLTLQPGDRLLLCSDGVDGVLSADEMQKDMGGDPQVAADGLIARLKALGRKNQDNATVAILACPGSVDVPVVAPADTPKPRRRRWLGTVAGVFVLLGVLGAGGWYWFGWPLGTGAPKTDETARSPVPQVPATDQTPGENENTAATPDTTSAAPPNPDHAPSGSQKTETTATRPTTPDTKPTNPDHPASTGKKTETKAASPNAKPTTPPEPAPAAPATKKNRSASPQPSA